MSWQERIIDVDHVREGMFVCRLDRPWEGTPFPLQGFLVSDKAQIDELKKLCEEVTIDVAQSHESARDRALNAPLPRKKQSKSGYNESDRVLLSRNVRHVDTVQMREELPQAQVAHDALKDFSAKAIADVRAGRNLHADEITEAVVPVVQSVLRSSDAVFWLNALQIRSEYEYQHALNCTVLAVAFGRHLGFPEKTLVEMATGGLLLDVGKAQVAEDILLNPGPLTEAQRNDVRRHVEFGLEIINSSGQASTEVLAMAGSHHERIDGSGYPKGLAGHDIPLFGRIAAIIDVFDALSSDRAYRPAVARHEATGQLYRARNTLFQAELVEQFTQCIGVFPTGSLIELNTGEVGIVMAQNKSRALCPRVMLLTTADKTLREDFREIDILAENQRAGSPTKLRVLRALDPGSYGLNTADLYL